MRSGALEGITVLDLTRVLAGPFSTMMMADMGANVIKIERPKVGDDSRQFSPFQGGESAYYMNLNRNKKGVTLNLKDPKGKEIFKELVKKADIVIENYRPGVMNRLGLSYDVLKKVNPRIIYASVSGFGQYGPYTNRPGYDIIGQAMSGLMSTTGTKESGPIRTGTAISDVLGGLSVTIGILSALYNRDVTGKGQAVDVSLVDSSVAGLEIINQIYLVEGRIPQRIGNRYESTYPYDSFKTIDGDVVIGAANNKLWKELCEVMGKKDLAEDERYNEVYKRVEKHVEVKKLVEEWTKSLTMDEIVKRLLDKGVPVAPINTIDRVVNDEHIGKAREMFVEVDHPKAGKMKLTGCHIKLSDTKPSIRKCAPLLGEDNFKVYSEYLGLSKEEIDELKRDSVL
ncbi:CaiB/BaiF CoA transferase family protein [Eubacterium multiforme]|uniref:Formyl-CoA transferase n=1 Tax=Eubacterium multiforme TaxID=83339 RepID=A0ABT9UQV9_9FIRM|nr:CoA transferase [Eubacterium multiforme]MDQ0149021.1 formyl-CoA transferase [Eubacterium multiforme]